MKLPLIVLAHGGRLSRPTRGAWIEIEGTCSKCNEPVVAPHTGRVD